MGTIGTRIRELRKAHDLTQVALAKAIGIDQSTLSDIERGVGFGADILVRLCAELHATAEYIMTGADPASWPFDTIPLSRFDALTEKQKGYVEARLMTAIEDAERQGARPPLKTVSLTATSKRVSDKKAG